MNDFSTCHYCDRRAWYQDPVSGEMLCLEHSRLEPRGPKARHTLPVAIRSGSPADLETVLAFWRYFWNDDGMDCFNRYYEAVKLDHLLACSGDRVVGLLSYAVERDRDAINIVALNILADCQGRGVGSRLIGNLAKLAGQLGIGKLIVATSNDNPLALYFYQRLGFIITGVEIGVIQPSGPDDDLIGMGGIPVRDEIQLAKQLSNGERTGG